MNYSGFWKRVAAWFIDSIIMNFIFGIFMFAIHNYDKDLLFFIFTSTDYIILLYIILLIVIWLYFALMENSSKQGTIGKIALGIKITDIEGNKISFGKASGRYFGKIISSILLFIGYFMIAFTKKKQGLHDIMSGCVVVNK